MAEPEESPSSLAELEALAGLDGEPAPSVDDGAADADPADFDLARLAASAAVGADGVAASSDDDRLDLGSARASAADALAGATEAPADRAVVETPRAAPNATSSASNQEAQARSGFVPGLLAGIAVAGVLFLFLRTPPAVDTPKAAPSPAVASPSGAASAAAPAMSPLPSTSSVRADGDAVAAVPPVTERSAPTKAASPAATSGPRSAEGNRVAPHPPSTTSADPTTETRDHADDPTRPPSVAQPETPPASSRPIDSLLDDALGSGKTKQTKAAQDNLMGQELPAAPTAADVTQVIQVLLPAIRGCAMGQSGVANTLLVVRNDGGVASASITGAPYAGEASGRCMEGVLRRAKFPRFRQSVFRVQFPLSIRASS